MRKGQSVRSISTHTKGGYLSAAGRIGVSTLTVALALSIACTLPFGTAAANEIVVTVAGPASGPHSDRTVQMLSGARRAAADINAKGGIKGATVTIDTADDSCAAEPAKSTATALSLRKVDLVIGHPCAAAANAAAKIYGEAQTLFIATGTRHRAFQRGSSTTIFRLSGRDGREGVEAALYLVERFKGQKIAVVHDRTSASIQLAEDAIEALLKGGASAPITGTVVGGDKDFPLLTAKIKSAAAIFYAGYPLEAGMLYAQLRATGSTAAFLMSNSNGTDEFTETFGERAEGVLIMRPRFGLQRIGNTDNGAPVVEAEIANADQALAAAAVAAYAAAANFADSINPVPVARELSARSYTTVNGIVGFDATGEAQRASYDVFEWTGKAWDGADIAPLKP